MAEEKITIVDLRKAIAKQTNVDEAQVGFFLSQLIAAVKEGLKKDKLVKISGLGTFKLQWVEPRKSVNISTGEPIVIEGYQKLSFTPEPSVKERINEPYADLVPVELDAEGNPIEPAEKPKSDRMQRFDEQALEIKDLLADLGADMGTPQAQPAEEPAAVAEEIPATEEPQAENVQEIHADEPADDNQIDKAIEAAEATVAAVREIPKEPLNDDEEPLPEEPKEIEQPAEEQPAVSAEEPAEEAPAEEKQEVATEEKEQEVAPAEKAHEEEKQEVASEEEKQEEAPASQPAKKEKKFHGWLVALITVIVLLLLLVAAALFFQRKIELWADMLNGKTGGKEYVQEEQMPLPASTCLPDSLSADSLAEEAPLNAETAEQEAPARTTDFYRERNYTDFIGLETVKEGSRLTWIAKKYYGSKDHWVFIYEANREKIKNPGNVGIGTQLRIPALPDDILDPDNIKAQHLIKELQDKYLN